MPKIKSKIEKMFGFLEDAGFGPLCEMCSYERSCNYDPIKHESMINPPCKYVKEIYSTFKKYF